MSFLVTKCFPFFSLTQCVIHRCVSHGSAAGSSGDKDARHGRHLRVEHLCVGLDGCLGVSCSRFFSHLFSGHETAKFIALFDSFFDSDFADEIL